jgi:tetratricopeptide (TPR) repeat protein
MTPRNAQKHVQPKPSSDRWWPAAVIVAAGFLTYLNSLSGPFVFDDYLSVLQNSHIRRWWDLRSVLFPEQDSPFAGRPLVNFSFALNYAIGGLDVRGYHLVNIAVHLVCGLLVYGVVRRTLELPSLRNKFGSVSVWLAFAIASIWTLHPLNTEAVDYLTERTESLMALFYLLTMYASIRAVGSEWMSKWTALALASCALGMACKETMATAPVALALYDRVYVFDSFRQAFRTRWRFYSGLAATWVILLALMWPNPRGGSAGFSSDVRPWTYLLNQTVMITQYLSHAVWPRSLVVNYGWPLPLTLGDVLPYACLIVLLLLLALVALFRVPKLGYLGAWVFITLAPTSSIVPIVTEVGAERRMYLPLIGIAALAVLAVWTLWKVLLGERRTVAAGLTLGAVSAVLAISTIDRNREYASGLSLIRTAVERWPSSASQHILGETLVAAGSSEEAIPYLRAAAPGAPRAHLTLGIALFNQGRLHEAAQALETLIRIQQSPPAEHPHWQAPLRADVIMARRLLADALLGQQTYGQAIAAYNEYLESRPTDADALSNLGIALVSSGRHDEAIQAFRRSAALAPNDGAVQRNLADALFDAEKVDEAAVHAARAVELRPDDSAAHDLLGRALAVQGKVAEAVFEFERALKIDPGNTEARDHLARTRQLGR